MSEMIALSDFDDDDRHYMKWMSYLAICQIVTPLGDS